MNRTGKVFLVGSGPGSVDLLTIRAHRTIQEADIVLYDSLAYSEIIDLVPERAEKVYVGKRMGSHSLSQAEINQEILKAAKKYKRVVRLKGGDPFIFGRGGEEINFLHENKIEFEVIPGITAAVAASASLKMPLTHRDFGQSVIFLSGYTKNSNDSGLPEYDWKFLARQSLTLVFYMGLHHAGRIADKLMENGMSSDTGVALVSAVSLPHEQVFFTTLHELRGTLNTNKIAQ